MKKLLLFVTFILISCAWTSAQISHDLEIYSEGGEKFTLIINGREMNQAPVSNVQIMNTDKDYVSAKIVFEDSTIPTIEKKFLQIAEPGTSSYAVPVSCVYKIINKKGEYKLRFASRSQKKIQPNTEVIIYNNPEPVNGKVVISW